MNDFIEVLNLFGIDGEVTKITQGPMIKQIAFLPKPGTKIKTVAASLSDIARELGVNSLRIEPIPDSKEIGFEIPADIKQTVDFVPLLSSAEFENAEGALPLLLGVDIIGRPVFSDLAKMPHLLVAGTTGSGKSVGLNTFILSLIKRRTPKDLQFVLIDPKRIEFSLYNSQKYMLFPVVTDNVQAADALNYLVSEMENRYALFEDSLSKNIADYNARAGHLPYIVCVIDEFSDLILSNKKVEKSILLLAQKARAAGIHIILATQRPSVDIVTGALKANFPTRLSYKVASQVDSRTILDTPGAEDLIGRGDALFLSGDGTLKRIHGAYVSDSATDKLLSSFRSSVKPFPVKKEEPVLEKKAEAKEKTTGSKKKETSLVRSGLKTWSNLNQREKKTIITGATVGAGWLFKTLFGGKKKK